MAAVKAVGVVVFLMCVMGASAFKCPPKGFDSVDNLNLTEFIKAPWYVQAQQPLAYQPVDQLYCVRAIYEPLKPDNLLKGLIVKNYANKDEVNGPALGTSGAGEDNSRFSRVFSDTRLLAKIRNPHDVSKLRVGYEGPLGVLTGNGPYWVVGVGENEATGAYDWAIITGGAPEVRGEEGCLTNNPSSRRARFQFNGVGFWLFSRTPVDPANKAIMIQKAKDLGLDTTVLVDVPQQNCLYVS